MPLSENKVIIACAGSGKTTRLVNEALSGPDRRIAIIAYTNNNIREIVKRFGEKNSGVPKHVDVMTWFAFLLRECARPYQRAKYAAKRVESLLFVNGQSARYIAETDTAWHYFANGELIYSDKIAKFVVECEVASEGRVIRRLQQIYTDLYIDECQDLAGWDWNFIELLLQSPIRTYLVGDPRQSVLTTNPARKNQRYRKSGVTEQLAQWEAQGLCKIEMMNETRRCNREICEFVNKLWPGMDGMSPVSDERSGHDGVFLVAERNVGDYLQCFRPQVLRHGRRHNAPDYERAGLNFGVAKGMECERVLIVPTKPISKFLKSGDPSPLKGKEKLHVAVTRAFHSVAFVHDGSSVVVSNRWAPASL